MSDISHAQHPISTLSLALFADSKPHFPLLLILVLSRLLEPTALPAEAHVGRGAGSPASTSVPWSMHHSLGRARVRARNAVLVARKPTRWPSLALERARVSARTRGGRRTHGAAHGA